MSVSNHKFVVDVVKVATSAARYSRKSPNLESSDLLFGAVTELVKNFQLVFPPQQFEGIAHFADLVNKTHTVLTSWLHMPPFFPEVRKIPWSNSVLAIMARAKRHAEITHPSFRKIFLPDLLAILWVEQNLRKPFEQECFEYDKSLNQEFHKLCCEFSPGFHQKKRIASRPQFNKKIRNRRKPAYA